MTSSFTEDPHTGEFLISEAQGKRSRESATVASGQTLKAGAVVMLNGSSKLVAHDGNLNSDGTVTTDVAGILWNAVDASGGDVANCAYVARDAEVNDNLLTYPTESTAGGEKAGCQASLASLGIIVR